MLLPLFPRSVLINWGVMVMQFGLEEGG